MRKKLAFISLFMICTALFCSANIGTFDKDRDTWLIDTGKIKCEFLEGCMFPVFFQKNGQFYPNFSLLDELQTSSGKYYLKEERWANIKIIENTPEVFKAECRGRFGRNGSPRYRIYKASDAVYRYTFRKNSGKVEMSAEVTIKDKAPVKYMLFHAGWLYHEFPQIIINGQAVRTVRGRRIVFPDSGAVLKNAMGSIALPGDAEFNISYKRYDKNSNLFQYIILPKNRGDLKKAGRITADLTLEFR